MGSHRTRIAHLSDVHVLAERPGRPRKSQWSVRLLSLGRALDPRGRVERLRRAIRAAKRACADHLIFSGDLTESGEIDQFETFAGVLLDEAVDPDRVTLVPGNHDVYAHAGAWRQALDGPLRPFGRGAADEAGKLVEREDVMLLPVNVTRHQPIAGSGGALSDETARVIERRLRDSATRRKALAWVQHHPPYAHSASAWQWIDGLEGGDRIGPMLGEHARLHVLHGHLHRAEDRPHDDARVPRVFGAPAVVEDGDDRARVRMYEVEGSAIRPAGILRG